MRFQIVIFSHPRENPLGAGNASEAVELALTFTLGVCETRTPAEAEERQNGIAARLDAPDFFQDRIEFPHHGLSGGVLLVLKTRRPRRCPMGFVLPGKTEPLLGC